MKLTVPLSKVHRPRTELGTLWLVNLSNLCVKLTDKHTSSRYLTPCDIFQSLITLPSLTMGESIKSSQVLYSR